MFWFFSSFSPPISSLDIGSNDEQVMEQIHLDHNNPCCYQKSKFSFCVSPVSFLVGEEMKSSLCVCVFPWIMVLSFLEVKKTLISSVHFLFKQLNSSKKKLLECFWSSIGKVRLFSDLFLCLNGGQSATWVLQVDSPSWLAEPTWVFTCKALMDFFFRVALLD